MVDYKELTQEETQRILLNYLKNFAVYFSDEEEDSFKEKFSNLDTCTIQADDYETLRKAICYILLSLGKKVNYIYLKSNDVIDSMLNDDLDEEEYSFQDLQEVPLLIIYHPKLWKKNKILWETLNYLADTRQIEGKKTLVITDSYRLYDEHGSLQVGSVISLSKNPPIMDCTPISNFLGSSSTAGIYD